MKHDEKRSCQSSRVRAGSGNGEELCGRAESVLKLLEVGVPTCLVARVERVVLGGCSAPLRWISALHGRRPYRSRTDYGAVLLANWCLP